MKPFAICIDDTDYKASLIRGKVYQVPPDPKAAKDDLVRIVDFPAAVRRKLRALESAAS